MGNAPHSGMAISTDSQGGDVAPMSDAWFARDRAILANTCLTTGLSAAEVSERQWKWGMNELAATSTSGGLSGEASLATDVARMCTVLRDGIWQCIEARDLVPGDVLQVVAGGRVHADGVLVSGNPVRTHQYALTGEREAVWVHPGDKCYSGSVVVGGEGVCVVTAIGPATLMAHMAKPKW